MDRRKQRVSAAGLFCALAILAAGCAGSEQTQQEDEREELVLWSYYETERQQESMDQLVDGFNRSQDDYHLVWEYQGPVTEFKKKLAIGITQDQFPDMVIVDNPDMLYYISIRKFEDLTDELEELEGLDEYFPSAMEAVEQNGRYYGLPFCCNNACLIYNKDMLEEAGVDVPQTLDELEQTAQILSKEGRSGFGMSAVSGEQGAFQFANIMLAAGEELEDAGSEETLRALELVQEMVRNGSMSSECVNLSQNDVARRFIEGKIAMMENGPWVFPALDEAGISYEIAPFPSDGEYRGLLGGEVIAVIREKNLGGSMEFLKYYGKRETMLNANFTANSLPPRKDAAKLFLNVKPEFEVINDQLENCISRTGYAGWTELSSALDDGLYRVLTGEESPEEVCIELRDLTDPSGGAQQ